MPLLRAHTAPAAIVLAALGAVAAVFLFARPQYRPPHSDGHAVSGTAYEAALHGWTWREGLPGGGMDSEAGDFPLAHVTRAALAPARRAAARAGIDPASVRPLHVLRYSMGRDGFDAILAGRGDGGRTCLGFVVPGHGTSFVCPQEQKAFAIATALPVRRSPLGPEYSVLVLAIARGDVTGATASQYTVFTDMRGHSPRVVRRHEALSVYDKRGGWWGTFIASPNGRRTWETRLVLNGDRGRTGTLPIRMSRPGSRLFVAR